MKRTDSRSSATPSKRKDLRQLLDGVDYRRFGELDLPVIPKNVMPTGTLSRSQKRLLVLRANTLENGAEVFRKMANTRGEHIQHHINQLVDPSAAEPNCDEHNEEMAALKASYDGARRDFIHLNEVLRATLMYEFGLEGAGEIEVFKGGKFVFTPKKASAKTFDPDGALSDLPEHVRNVVQAFAKTLGADVVGVERVSPYGSPISHTEIAEILEQLESLKSGPSGEEGRRATFNGERSRK